MVIARVTLKKAKSYRFGGRRWLQDVPQTINSKKEDVQAYIENGYFAVKILKDTSSSKESKEPKKEKKSDDDSSLSSKKVKKKTGSALGLKKRS